MKVLMINKFLYPKGGTETYMLTLGEYLETQGIEVQYFGMNNQNRSVGNSTGSYVEDIDFHKKDLLYNIKYALKSVYSVEARKKIRKVLNDFNPDVCHINNFNYQLTPSIILEIVKWRSKNNKKCKVIYTAHDYQLLCPNHMMYIPKISSNCELCLSGKYFYCVKNRCIHDNFLKSVIGAIEGKYWNLIRVYKHFDRIICCSDFIKNKFDRFSIFKDKTITIHNFCNISRIDDKSKKDYVLYFGRYSKEKGLITLLEAVKKISNINFVFAGDGELLDNIKEISNIKNVGFIKGDRLRRLIAEARFSVCPSEWYENCPYSILESQALGTPVIGANIGGIPEIVVDEVNGILFKSGDVNDLISKINKLWFDKGLLSRLENNCNDIHDRSVKDYFIKYRSVINSI